MNEKGKLSFLYLDIKAAVGGAGELRNFPMIPNTLG